MERILSQRLNAFLLSHNKSEDEQEKAKMRRSLRRDLRSAQLRIVNKHWETEPDFDEEATITTVGFYFEGKRLTLVKIETNLRRLDLREFVRFDYAVGDINITAVMRPKDEVDTLDEEEEEKNIVSGICVCVPVDVYYNDDSL